jgi:hypothetical protein
MIGEWKLYAGAYQSSGTTDGDRLAAKFNAPADATSDNRYLWIADYGNKVIRVIDVNTGDVDTLADVNAEDAGFGPHAVMWDGADALWVAATDNDTLGTATTNMKFYKCDTTTGTLTHIADKTTSLTRFGHVVGQASDECLIVPRNHLVYLLNEDTTETSITDTVGNSFGTVWLATEGLFIQDSFISGVGARVVWVNDTDAWDYATHPTFPARASYTRIDPGWNASHIKPSFIYDDDHTFLVSNYDDVVDSDDTSDPATSEYVGCYAKFSEVSSVGTISAPSTLGTGIYPMGQFFVQHVSPTDYYGGSSTANAITAQTHDVGPPLVECLGNVFLISEKQHAIYVWESTDQADSTLRKPENF